MGASPEPAGGGYRFARRYRNTETISISTRKSSSKSLVALALSLAAAAALLATSSLLLAANAPRPGGVTLVAPRPGRIDRDKAAGTPAAASLKRKIFSRSRPVVAAAAAGVVAADAKEEEEDKAAPTTARALAAVASLRQLFDQQRSSQTPQQASEPSAAGLRAAAAAALDAAALALDPAASASLAAAKRKAEKLVLDSLLQRQFPQDCSKSKFLVGAIDKFCGFACQVHHAVHLLAAAAATNRVLVLYTESWRYDRTPEDNDIIFRALDEGRDEPVLHPGLAPGRHTEGRWEELFQPVTNCTVPGMEWATTLPPFLQSKEDDADYIGAPAVVAGIVDGGAGALKSDPPAVPPDVLRLALEFSGRPEAWWSGTLASFLLRPSERAEREYRRFAAEHGLELELVPASASATSSPSSLSSFSSSSAATGANNFFAALHVRRTDKVTSPDGGRHAAEADEAELERYFEALDEWSGVARAAAAAASREEGEDARGAGAGDGGGPGEEAGAPARKNADPRPTVFVATDDPAVLSEIRAAPYARNYRVVGNAASAAAASQATRWGPDSLRGVASDLYFLSRADFLIGTFSSQVSRLAYELRQVVGPVAPSADASLRFHSVDASHWYMGGGRPMRFCAVSDFDARFVSDAEEEGAAREMERAARQLPRDSSPSSSSSSSSPASDPSGGSAARVAEMMRTMREESRRAAKAATAPTVIAKGDPLLCEASPDTKRGAVKCRATRLAREVWASPAMLRRCEDWWRGVPVL